RQVPAARSLDGLRLTEHVATPTLRQWALPQVSLPALELPQLNLPQVRLPHPARTFEASTVALRRPLRRQLRRIKPLRIGLTAGFASLAIVILAYAQAQPNIVERPLIASATLTTQTPISADVLPMTGSHGLLQSITMLVALGNGSAIATIAPAKPSFASSIHA